MVGMAGLRRTPAKELAESTVAAPLVPKPVPFHSTVDSKTPDAVV